MRIALCLFLVGCGGGSSTTMMNDDAPEPDAPVVAAKCPDGSPLGTLANKPTFSILIDGKGPYTFVYDTGAPGTVLDNAVRAQIGGGPYTFDVGGRKLPAGTLQAVDIASTFGFSGAGGIIGTDILGTKVVTIDRARSKFWIDDSLDEAALVACTHAGAPTIANAILDQYFYVRGREESLDGWFLVDTGATLGAVTESTFQTLQQQHARPALGGFFTHAGIGDFWAQLATVGAMAVGDARVEHLAIRTIPDNLLPRPTDLDAPFIGLLPNGYFRHVLLTVDYPGRRIRFAPYANDTMREPTFVFSIGIGLASNTMTPPRIATVIAGSSAAQQGISVGDELLKIGATDVSAIPAEQRAWALVSQAQSPISVTVRNATGTRTLSLAATDVLVAP